MQRVTHAMVSLIPMTAPRTSWYAMLAKSTITALRVSGRGERDFIINIIAKRLRML